MRRPSRHLVTLGGLLVATVAFSLAHCGSEPRLIEWKRIDYDAVQEAMGSPTGALADIGSDAALDDIEQLIATLLEVTDELSVVPETIDELGEGEATGGGADFKSNGGSTSSITSGTDVFLAIACPGSYEIPARDFSHGQMRVESPVFTSRSQFADLLEGGDVLLLLEDCEIPTARVNGPVPALYRSANESMIADLTQIRLSYYLGTVNSFSESRTLAGETGLFVREVEITLDLQRRIALGIRALLRLADATFTLDAVRSGAEVIITIFAADGTIRCAYEELTDTFLGCDAE